MKRMVFLLVVAIMLGSPTWGNAATIGFDGLSSSGVFVGPVTEMGFEYSSVGDPLGLFSDISYGNPKPEMEAAALFTSYYPGYDAGILQIIGSTLGQSFIFSGMDIAQTEADPTTSHTITVDGYLEGSLVGAEYFDTPKSDKGSIHSPYITVAPDDVLSNAVIDKLLIHLPGRNDQSTVWFFARVDNIQLNPTPEPATILLLATGLIGLGMFRKKFR